jgi:hypothetical protein
MGTVYGQTPYDKQFNSLTNFRTPVATGELNQTSATTLGWVDNWSVAVWAKHPAPLSLVGILLSWRPVSGSLNYMEMGAINSGGLQFYLRITDNTGTSRQAAYWLNGIASGWRHYVVTWDGTANGLKVYFDTTLTAHTTPLIVPFKDSSTCVDTSRKIMIGGRDGGLSNRWPGPIYSAAIYSTVLDQSTINAMYNGGNAVYMDLLNDSGDYQSSAYLQDYYRVGEGSTEAEFGLDRGKDATSRNLSNPIDTFDATDLTTDVPL